MLSMEQLSQMVQEHLRLNNIDRQTYTAKWKLGESVYGRGLIATEDIQPGDVLFIDHPLIYGPRSGTVVQRGCTICCKITAAALKCSECALVVCSEECRNSDVHLSDCGVICRWYKKVPIEDVDEDTMSKALTAIRSLLLTEKQIHFMSLLAAHTHSQHGIEIAKIKQYFDIPKEEEQTMVLACCVLDTNAFQIATPYGKTEMSMRGLYPVSGLMNHCCVPNTRYIYNKELGMTVTAIKNIKIGMEIFSCYSGLLWGTPARRIHLFKTKHFLCHCERCADASERGTLLSALKCLSPQCQGSLIPIEPLKMSSGWRCLDCNLIFPYKSTAAIQNALGALMGSLNFSNVSELEHFLLNRITKYIPKSNQIVVDLQCRLIWELGDRDGLRWHELSPSQLSLKEKLCRATLHTLVALGVGDVHLRGLLLYHLHAALAERARRCPDQYEALKTEIESTIEQAYTILQDDISAPPDLDIRRKYLGPGCDNIKSKEERFFILES